MADEELAREEVGCECREDGRTLSPTGGHSDENNLEATELTASRVAKADFPGWSERRGGGCAVICGDYSISLSDTLLFVSSLVVASVLKGFQLYLSIKYTALLSFLFSCVSFFLFYLSIYQLVHAPFLSPLSLPYPIPSSSDLFSFFFFSSLPSYLLPRSIPPFSSSIHPLSPWTTHRLLLQPNILLTALIWT